MLFADYISTSKQSISLVAVGCLQGCKDSDITRLELVGCVRREAIGDIG
jgi:hypothetical protein